MNKPLISIIIPVFNSQAYIKKCLDSIVNQTYQNLEIIVVNDGSTDNSRGIIEEYGKSDNRIKFFHKENGGIGSAYILALNHVNGDYITFVDSDDWAELNLYEELIKIAKKENPDFISFGKVYVNEKGEKTKLGQKAAEKVIHGRDSILRYHFEEMKHPSLGRLFKKELFTDLVIFDQNIGVDEMLTPQLLAKCNRAVYTSKVLHNVLVRDDSVCRTQFDEQRLLDAIKVTRFLCAFAEKNIPDFAVYPQLKHLKALVRQYNFSIENKALTKKTNIKEVAVELKKYYFILRSTGLYKKQSFKLRFTAKSIVAFPKAYKLYNLTLKLARISYGKLRNNNPLK